MTQAVIRLANYVKELTGYNADEILIGRENFYYASRKDKLILIEHGSSQNVSMTQEYDKPSETLTLARYIEQDFIVNFYGDTSYDDIHKFMLRYKTQAARDKQKSENLKVYAPGNMRRLAFKQEQEYFTERYAVDLKILYNESHDESALRIDTGNLQYTFNK